MNSSTLRNLVIVSLSLVFSALFLFVSILVVVRLNPFSRHIWMSLTSQKVMLNVLVSILRHWIPNYVNNKLKQIKPVALPRTNAPRSLRSAPGLMSMIYLREALLLPFGKWKMSRRGFSYNCLVARIKSSLKAVDLGIVEISIFCCVVILVRVKVRFCR